MAAVSGADFSLVLLIGLLIPIWAVIDALGRPPVAFYAAGYNRTAWLLVLCAAAFFGVGLLFGTYYFVWIRRRVRREMHRLSA